MGTSVGHDERQEFVEELLPVAFLPELKMAKREYVTALAEKGEVRWIQRILAQEWSSSPVVGGAKPQGCSFFGRLTLDCCQPVDQSPGRFLSAGEFCRVGSYFYGTLFVVEISLKFGETKFSSHSGWGRGVEQEDVIVVAEPIRTWLSFSERTAFGIRVAAIAAVRVCSFCTRLSSFLDSSESLFDMFVMS